MRYDLDMTNGQSRPANPRLAGAFDKLVQTGYEIRYADETQVVGWKKNQWGCGGLIFLILLGVLTVFIVPLILLILGAFSPGGHTITYTLKPNGKLKKKQASA